MKCQHITFTGHAIQRMFEREITKDEVKSIITGGEPIVEYPDDSPYPSLLLLGWVEGRPLHVVVTVDDLSGTCYVVTVYVPSPMQWERDFRTRR